MELTSTPLPDQDIVHVTGRVDSLTAPRLADALKGILDAGRYQIVLDLANVNYVSSAGLRVLIDAQKTCKPHGGEVALSGVPQRVLETLELAGLVHLFRFDNSM